MKNVVASVLARLKNRSAETKEDFNGLLQQYVLERFLHRLSRSPHAPGVILKGALLLRSLDVPQARPTMDIDFLRRGKADRDTLMQIVNDCATLEVEDDGVVFLAETIVAADIDKDGGYTGTRVLFDARMHNVKARVQIDFGVGDLMVPGPNKIQFPTILNAQTIEIEAYPLQSAIAEKLQAMVNLGMLNSRLKDYYDVWICKQVGFDSTLLGAIQTTFAHRNTKIPDALPEGLSDAYVTRGQPGWRAFCKRIGQPQLLDQFPQVVTELREFAMPAFMALAQNKEVSGRWDPAKGWVDLGVSSEVELDTALAP